MKAANSVRRLPERPTVVFSAFRPVDKAPFEFTPGDTSTKSFQLNNSDLVIDDHDVTPDQQFTVDFLAEDIIGGKLYLTSTESMRDYKSPLYYRVPLAALPDGEYRIYEHAFFADEARIHTTCLPRFVRVCKGEIVLKLRPAYTPPPQPITADAPINFNLMLLSPSVSFTPDARLQESSLLITPDSVVTVRLPPAKSPLKMEITLLINAEAPIPALKIYHEKQLLTKAELVRNIVIQIPFTIPPGLSELKLSIKPELDHPERVKFRLKEIKLQE